MSQPTKKKTLADVQAAFETRRILHSSRSELEQLLVAASAEAHSDPAIRAQAHEMSETMRGLLEARSPRPRSRMALVAALLAFAALLCSVAQGFYYRRAEAVSAQSAAEMSDFIRATNRDLWPGDPRMQVTIEEMARRAPSLSTGTLQAWWAGEQARQVQQLEAQAKRQMIVGDREGAVRNVKRADAIRSGIESLASYEKPPQR